uniref:Phytocyanin domain-containing protein n=1 Tax=Oryza barthii TaxID=65489 RepID=A0A0D3GCM4_9ORYZ
MASRQVLLLAIVSAVALLPAMVSATDYTGKHTVTEVDGAAFHACNRQGNTLMTWNSGNDTVALDKAGKRWFFCNVDNHCELGMKLVVDVADPNAPAPASPPPPSSTSSAGRLNYRAGGGVVAGAVAAAAFVWF